MNKLNLGTFPTPFQELKNVPKQLNSSNRIFIKRDDMTGLALGGNKVRKLQYVLSDAVDKGADTIMTAGGAQSNHCAITAAACNSLGLEAHLVLHSHGITAPKGNQLLYNFLGAKTHWVDDGMAIQNSMDNLAIHLKNKGKSPYIVPIGASMPLGALGYVDAMEELHSQTINMGITVDHIICTMGSGGTYAGVLLGAKKFFPNAIVNSMDVIGSGTFTKRLPSLILDTQALMSEKPFEGINEINDAIRIIPSYGKGYAIPSEEGEDAIKKLALWEGLILDPVYTGKTFAGLLQLFAKKYFSENENIVFIHTGGAASLFAFY